MNTNQIWSLCKAVKSLSIEHGDLALVLKDVVFSHECTKRERDSLVHSVRSVYGAKVTFDKHGLAVINKPHFGTGDPKRGD